MANNAQLCPKCKGEMTVANRRGEIQACPICEGAGTVTPQPIRVPFKYVFDRALAAAGRIAAAINFDKDADFELVWLMATQTGAFTSELKDSATGRDLQSAPVNNANRFGTAQLPFPLVEPYIFAAGTSLSVTLVDTSGAPNTIQLVFDGFKLFRLPQ